MALTSGCSGKKKTDEAGLDDVSQTDAAASKDEATAGTDAVPATTEEGKAAPEAEEAALPVPPTQDPNALAANPAPEASPSPEGSESKVVQNVPAPVEESAPMAAAAPEFSSTYTFQSSDTLMKIAFENYGDIYRWKKIYEDNRDKIQNPNAVPVGTVLKLEKPSSPVSIDRNGEKIVIRSGDTLGKISNRVYGTLKKWKRLWENNKQMIRDPNRIFAGFSLYYTFTEEDRQFLDKHQVNARVPASKK